MPAHNHRGVRSRHGGATNTVARTTHGGSFDPTGSQLELYGSQMDVGPVTSPDYQGQWHENEIADNAIGSQHIQELALLAEHLADNAIAQRHLQDLVVGTEEIQAAAVSTDKLAAFAVTAAKILAGTITADKIHADGLAANQITSGTLSVGGVSGAAAFIRVFDADGDPIVVVSEDSFLWIDADDSDLAIRVKNGILEFTDNFSVGEELADWSTAISAAGIRADSIKVGIAPGGHNLIPNSSFENSPYSTGLSKVWTTAGDWGTTIGTDVNIDKSTGDLKLTDATY